MFTPYRFHFSRVFFLGLVLILLSTLLVGCSEYTPTPTATPTDITSGNPLKDRFPDGFYWAPDHVHQDPETDPIFWVSGDFALEMSQTPDG